MRLCGQAWWSAIGLSEFLRAVPREGYRRGKEVVRRDQSIPFKRTNVNVGGSRSGTAGHHCSLSIAARRDAPRVGALCYLNAKRFGATGVCGGAVWRVRNVKIGKLVDRFRAGRRACFGFLDFIARVALTGHPWSLKWRAVRFPSHLTYPDIAAWLRTDSTRSTVTDAIFSCSTGLYIG